MCRWTGGTGQSVPVQPPGEDVLGSYRRTGWTVVDRVVSADALRDVVSALDEIYPTGEAYAADPTAYGWVAGGAFAGLRWWPTGVAVLDDLVVDDRIVAIAEQVLRSTDIRLLRGAYQAKYTGAAGYAQ